MVLNNFAQLIKAIQDNNEVSLTCRSVKEKTPSEKMAQLSVALAKNTTLKILNLTYNELGEQAGIAIGETLKTNTTLTSLRLYRNQLGEQAGIAIGEALKTNTTLTKLGLDSNHLGEQAGIAIGEALKTNTTLTVLDLHSNQLGEQAGIAIGEALKTNTTLARLGLNSNHLGEQAGIAIGEALKTNTTLTVLNLSSNQLGEQSGIAIGEALKTNSTLTALDLNSNQLSNKSAFILALKLQSNTGLHHLKLADNNIGFLGITALKQLKRKNTKSHESDSDNIKKQIAHKTTQRSKLQFELGRQNPSTPSYFTAKPRTTKLLFKESDTSFLESYPALTEKIASAPLQTLANCYYTYVLYQLDALSLGSLVFKKETRLAPLEIDSNFAKTIRKSTSVELGNEYLRLYHMADQDKQASPTSREYSIWSVIAELKEMSVSTLSVKEMIELEDLDQLKALEEKIKYKESRIDSKQKDKKVQTLLHTAAQTGNVSVLEYVLSKDIPINAQDQEGNTPLHLAALNGHKAAVDCLIQHKADDSLPNSMNFIPEDYLETHSAYTIGKRPDLHFDNLLATKNFDYLLADYHQTMENSGCRKQFLSLPKEDRLSLFEHADALLEQNPDKTQSERQALLEKNILKLALKRTQDQKALDKERIRQRFEQFQYHQGLIRLLKQAKNQVNTLLQQLKKAANSTAHTDSESKAQHVELLCAQNHFQTLFDELIFLKESEAQYKALFATSNPSLPTFYATIVNELTSLIITKRNLIRAGIQMSTNKKAEATKQGIALLGVVAAAGVGIPTLSLGTLAILPVLSGATYLGQKLTDWIGNKPRNKRQKQKEEAFTQAELKTQDELKYDIIRVALSLTAHYQNAIRQCTEMGAIKLAKCWVKRFKKSSNNDTFKNFLQQAIDDELTEQSINATTHLIDLIKIKKEHSIETKYLRDTVDANKQAWTDRGIFEQSGIAYPIPEAILSPGDIVPPLPEHPNQNMWIKRECIDPGAAITKAVKYGYKVFANEETADRYELLYNRQHRTHEGQSIHWQTVDTYGPPALTIPNQPHPETMQMVLDSVSKHQSTTQQEFQQLKDEKNDLETKVEELENKNESLGKLVRQLKRNDKIKNKQITNLKKTIGNITEESENLRNQLGQQQSQLNALFTHLGLGENIQTNPGNPNQAMRTSQQTLQFNNPPAAVQAIPNRNDDTLRFQQQPEQEQQTFILVHNSQ